MRKQLIVLLTAFALAIILCGSATASESNNESEYSSEIINTNIPFVENQGQTDEEVEYYADTFYGTVYITNDTITHAVKGANNTTMVLQEQFLDANGEAIVFQPSGLEQGSAKVDYYMGNDPSKWRTAINTWNTISLGELYPGITVILKAHGANIEKIFQIAPGANPDDINIQVLGADQIQLNANGDLILSTLIGDIQLTKPIAYQADQSVPVQYTLQGNTYRFQVGSYDTTKELIIDPTLLYSTYIGGVDNDIGYGITVDGAGNIYVTGTTTSSDFPTTPGAFQEGIQGMQDVFILMLSPNTIGTYDLKYSTYLGGAEEDDVGFIRGIVLDSVGNIYVTGFTNSDDFPTTPGAYQDTNHGGSDAFIVMLSPNGSGTNDLKYSTYLGGIDADGGNGIVLDGDGNIYIAGQTYSDDFPTTPGAYQDALRGSVDAFIVVLSPDGGGVSDLKYSTYLGGTGEEGAWSIVLDSVRNIYITGPTGSDDFPTTPGAYQDTNHGLADVFIVKLSPDGSGASDLKYSTYLGGTEVDDPRGGIWWDNDGNIYITGYTESSDFPTTPGAYQDALRGHIDIFIVVLSPDGSGVSDLKYSTYLGGEDEDFGHGIVLDSEGNIYITGETGSDDFPTTPGAYQENNPGDYNAFIVVLSPDGSGTYDLKYSTYLGGTGDSPGNGIVLDGNGNLYITGVTNSDDFPTTPGAYQAENQGNLDAFIVKFGLLTTTLTVNSPSGYNGDTVDVTATLTDTMTNNPVANKPVTITVNGQSYTALTNSAGQVTWKFPINNMVAKQYTIQASFAGDILYAASSAIGTLTVNAGPTPTPNPAHAKTIAMQKTGIPLVGMILAILMVMGGFISTRKK